MDELAGPVPHVAPDRFFGRSVATVEATEASTVQNVLDSRCCKTGLVGDVVSAPTTVAAQP